MAALATVPEIKRTDDVFEVAKRRFARHGAGEEPHRARDRVIDEAVQSFAATGRWPSDIGERAATAYADGMSWEAERLALKHTVEFTEDRATDAFETFAPDALAHLSGRLADVLSDALAASEKLGGARARRRQSRSDATP
ncbi:hypothetical protein OHB11_32185 [Streptomyces zaomyceticus]|uniref:hypothetical protein n=1 Tax=Streptomyces zaomyceticus TaxID=68286 RepID=UPI00325623E8